EVRKVGANHSGRAPGDTIEVDVVGERDVTRVHFENPPSAGTIGRLDGDTAVEAAWAEQRRIEDVRSVGRCDDDHSGVRVEAVHLGEDLIEHMLELVAATTC